MTTRKSKIALKARPKPDTGAMVDGALAAERARRGEVAPELSRHLRPHLVSAPMLVKTE